MYHHTLSCTIVHYLTLSYIILHYCTLKCTFIHYLTLWDVFFPISDHHRLLGNKLIFEHNFWNDSVLCRYFPNREILLVSAFPHPEQIRKYNCKCVVSTNPKLWYTMSFLGLIRNSFDCDVGEKFPQPGCFQRCNSNKYGIMPLLVHKWWRCSQSIIIRRAVAQLLPPQKNKLDYWPACKLERQLKLLFWGWLWFYKR